MKTKRGIEYDLEVYSFDGMFVCLTVTCENGSTDIYQAVTESERNAYIKTNDIYYLNLNFDEIERWVDATEISWAVSEVTKVCLMKSNDEWNYKFNIRSYSKLSIGVVKEYLKYDNIEQELIAIKDERFILSSLEQVNDWLCMNK